MLKMAINQICFQQINKNKKIQNKFVKKDSRVVYICEDHVKHEIFQTQKAPPPAVRQGFVSCHG